MPLFGRFWYPLVEYLTEPCPRCHRAKCPWHIGCQLNETTPWWLRWRHPRPHWHTSMDCVLAGIEHVLNEILVQDPRCTTITRKYEVPSGPAQQERSLPPGA